MALQEAVKTIVESLVQHPQDVEITTDELDNGTYTNLKISIKVNPLDRGRVIGRQGKTINALRTVVKAAAVKMNKRVNIKVIEDGQEIAGSEEKEVDLAEEV
ncbi:MAG: KH domain-containing protein [Candidatus Sericytochromatia bacterium]